MADKLVEWLLNQSERVVEIQKELVAIPALGPENGGNGEIEKGKLITKWLDELQVEHSSYDAPDSRVDNGTRPNIVAHIPGRLERKLWLFGHLDVVPPGDLSAWQSDPWHLRRDGDLIFGRGVEDNQQAVASMILLAEGIRNSGLVPKLGLGLVFMADEECGSNYGLKWLLQNHPDIFSRDDFFIIPDGGSPQADIVEIAEKAQLWLKFTVIGKQCHASSPQQGINAFVAASALVLELLVASLQFKDQNPLFSPPYSTFVPTMHEKNVPAINILPGKDVFFMDCRLLPGLDKDKVLGTFSKVCGNIENCYNVKVNMEVNHYQKASMTSPDAEIVRLLRAAVKKVYHLEPHLAGIGGATVAAMLRELEYPAIVWSCIFNTCHQPNERSSISATCKDAAVFAEILMLDGLNDQRNI